MSRFEHYHSPLAVTLTICREYNTRGEEPGAGDLDMDDVDALGSFQPVVRLRQCARSGNSNSNKKSNNSKYSVLCVCRYGSSSPGPGQLALNKWDGAPLNIMETLATDANKVYRYNHNHNNHNSNYCVFHVNCRYPNISAGSGVSCDFSCVRRDRPSCRFCKF